jgi:hypothetical protein
MESANEEEEGNEEDKTPEPKSQNTYKIYGTLKDKEDNKTPDFVKEIIKVISNFS